MCFTLKNDHNLKSCQNMLILWGVIFCIINYNFVLDTIYIASHLHVIKDSWASNKPKIFIFLDSLYFECFYVCLIVPYYYKESQH
jgi:hypothetical protein